MIIQNCIIHSKLAREIVNGPLKYRIRNSDRKTSLIQIIREMRDTLNMFNTTRIKLGLGPDKFVRYNSYNQDLS